MNRRKFMKASMALSAVSGMTGLSTLFAQSAWADDGIADGTAVRFDFDSLKKKASALAKQPWGGAPGPLPDTLAKLTPQAYNEIQYDANHSLWNNIPDRQLDVQFFHVGMGFKRRIRMFSVDAQSREAREIHFRPELFNYHNANVDTRQLVGKTDLGFAGFRAFKKPELARR
ncbi:glucan biosynthesis protein, partial [Pantoea endophytica]|uniref:glucan biosynthesis protein n=1 Tax=Pantoea endophytica TaxID=92488 RepID=UPI00289A65B4